ncbi:MAG TPA: PspA/IM30 family protein [Oscillatoriaceae cyanobacterium]
MGLWDRFSRMLKSNINDAIDKAEDPEKMLKQIVEELNEDLLKVKTQVATAIATEKQLFAKAQQLQEEADQWAKKAELAVSKGDDALAREALTRKTTAQTTADGFKTQWEEAKKSVAMLKENLARLEAKISEAQTKKELLIARHRRAEAEKRIQTTLSQTGGGNALSAFERMEAKVSEKEAQAAAYGELNASSLENRFEALSAPNVEDELAALKAKHDQALLPEQT